MAVKFFLVYLGGLLVGSIALFAIVKQFAAGFAASGKKPLVYGGLSSIITSLIGYASIYITENLFTVFWILAGVFLSFGIIHVLIVHNKYFSNGEETTTKTFIGEVIFALSVVLFTVLVFSSLQYFLKDNGKSFLFYPIMLSTFAFFIPVVVLKTFESAYHIPAPVYNTWLYPSAPINLPDDDPREKLLVIGFEIAKKITDTKKTYFRAKAPENIYLGDLYYFFIIDYNELQSETPIEFCKNEEPCKWVFQLKTKWYQGQKVLDPYLTIKDNGIKENSVIICDRV